MPKQKVQKMVQVEVTEPTIKYRYVCPKCTNTAIETSNLMLGVEVDCKSCASRIVLDNKKNYIVI